MLEALPREKRLHSSSFESSAYVWGKSGAFEALGYLPGFHLQHNPLIPETCIPDTEFGQSGSIQFLNILVVDPVGSCCPVSKRCPTGTKCRQKQHQTIEQIAPTSSSGELSRISWW